VRVVVEDRNHVGKTILFLLEARVSREKTKREMNSGLSGEKSVRRTGREGKKKIVPGTNQIRKKRISASGTRFVTQLRRKEGKQQEARGKKLRKPGGLSKGGGVL